MRESARIPPRALTVWLVAFIILLFPIWFFIRSHSLYLSLVRIGFVAPMNHFTEVDNRVFPCIAICVWHTAHRTQFTMNACHRLWCDNRCDDAFGKLFDLTWKLIQKFGADTVFFCVWLSRPLNRKSLHGSFMWHPVTIARITHSILCFNFLLFFSSSSFSFLPHSNTQLTIAAL